MCNDPFKDFFMKVQCVDDGSKMPTRAHDTDAGCDVYAPHDFTIPARGDYVMCTGWRYEMPKGFALIIEEKSGVATKKKLSVGAKVCDSDYRGLTHIHLFNHSDVEVNFEAGDKVAQFVVYPVWTGQPTEVDTISTDTDRGEGKFGSTGDK